MDYRQPELFKRPSPQYIPRSVSTESSSPRSSAYDYSMSQNTSYRSADRSSSRSMRIESLLNNDEDDRSHQYARNRYQYENSATSIPPRSSSSSYGGWTSANNVPSPSDGTSSFVDSSEYHDFGSSNESRENRPAYLIEEDTFIWYHRDDRGMKWDEVSAAFNEYFPKDRQRHGLQGIQGRYYRILKDEGVPKLRSRQKKRPRRDYGVVARTSRRYPWMIDTY